MTHPLPEQTMRKWGLTDPAHILANIRGGDEPTTCRLVKTAVSPDPDSLQ